MGSHEFEENEAVTPFDEDRILLFFCHDRILILSYLVLLAFEAELLKKEKPFQIFIRELTFITTKLPSPCCMFLRRICRTSLQNRSLQNQMGVSFISRRRCFIDSYFI